jgi:iron complex outermembrane receptor protein
MCGWQVTVSVRLALMMVLASGLVGVGALPGQSQTLDSREPTPAAQHTGAVDRHGTVGEPLAVQALEQTSDSVPLPAAEILPLREMEQPATTVEEWVAQIEASLTQITAVRVEATEAGLQVILETENGSLAVPETRSLGNALIADIPNATIAEEFSQADPIEGIALVSVTSLPGDRVRVAITGTDAPPVAEVTSEAQGLAFAVRLGEAGTAADEDAIQVVVTGEQEEGYNPSNTSIGTRTDTPLRDIPQSIQIIPQQVLEEQQVNTFNEALRNAPGVTQGNANYQPSFTQVTIRGFAAGQGRNITRNGLSLAQYDEAVGIFSNIERVEVLRGPASVLFGVGDPGGTINIVTKQPLRDPFYSVEATAGSYNLYSGAIDLTGPLNDARTILYRLNASYENAGSFVERIEPETSAVAGVLSFELGENTDLSLNAEYVRINHPTSSGLPLRGSILPNPNGEIPRNRNFGQEGSEYSPEVFTVGYNLEHRFNENWSLRNAFYFMNFTYRIRGGGIASLDPDLRTAQTIIDDRGDEWAQSFDLVTNVVGRFSTGDIQHQLLLGADLRRVENTSFGNGAFRGRPIDIFDPVYSSERFEQFYPPYDNVGLADSLGIYIQDQITIAENLKLLLSGRFDAFEQTNEDLLNDTEQFQAGNAFSPRLGIVYQPIEPISLYASYSRSFTPIIGRSRDGAPFEPGRGTQYEIGVKADINDSLSATLALYDLTRTNITTNDPDDPTGRFQIQTGEQNSQGIELFVSGEILPGWNVIAGYAYTNARITEDNTFEVGNRLGNVPEHSFNLWTSYEIQAGDFQGLGFGLGFFFVGDRQGNLGNSFTLPSYLRTDAAIFYNRGRFRASLNFNNLFDVNYFEAAYSDLQVFPAEPFTVQGTLAWEF